MNIKKLTEYEKKICKSYFDEVLLINELSFFGVERPPESALRWAFDTGDVFVAFSSQTGQTYGYAIVTLSPSPLIWSIAVMPNYRGTGVGMSLLMEIDKCFEGAEIRLTVNVNNSAQKLYFDAGYRVYNVARGFYREAGDGLIMKKPVSYRG